MVLYTQLASRVKPVLHTAPHRTGPAPNHVKSRAIVVALCAPEIASFSRGQTLSPISHAPAAYRSTLGSREKLVEEDNCLDKKEYPCLVCLGFLGRMAGHGPILPTYQISHTLRESWIS